MSVNTSPTTVPLDTEASVVEVHIDLSGPLTQRSVDAIVDACVTADGSDVVLLRLNDASATPAEWPGDVGVHLVGRWEKALRGLERLDRITVGVCEGRCGRAVLEVLLATDHRIVDAVTELAVGDTPTGIWPGMALHRLVQQSGLTAARRLLLATELRADELLAAGVADEVTTDVDAAVGALVVRLAGLVGTEVAVRRRLLLDAVTVGYEESLGTHLAACDRTLRSQAAR